MVSSSSKTGQCFCGKIKYQLSGPAAVPVRNVVCHCLNCRRISGSAFYVASVGPKEGFSVVEGEQFQKTVIDNKTDTGVGLERVFCSECGSNLFAFTPLWTEVVSVTAGTLDDFDSWVPDTEQYCIHRANFVDRIKSVDQTKVYDRSVTGDLK